MLLIIPERIIFGDNNEVLISCLPPPRLRRESYSWQIAFVHSRECIRREPQCARTPRTSSGRILR